MRSLDHNSETSLGMSPELNKDSGSVRPLYNLIGETPFLHSELYFMSRNNITLSPPLGLAQLTWATVAPKKETQMLTAWVRTTQIMT